MHARCLNCSKDINFRLTKGSKLADLICDCGSKVERMIRDHYEKGISPLGEEHTIKNDLWWQGTGFFVFRSSKGLFILNKKERKWYPFVKPT